MLPPPENVNIGKTIHRLVVSGVFQPVHVASHCTCREELCIVLYLEVVISHRAVIGQVCPILKGCPAFFFKLGALGGLAFLLMKAQPHLLNDVLPAH